MNNVSNNAQRFGLISGLVSILLMLVLYFIDARLLFHPLYSSLPFLVIFPVAMVLATLADRRERGGILKLTDAFKSAFVTGALGLFLLVAFNFILRVAIDPTLTQVAKEAAKELTIQIMSKAEQWTGEPVPDEAYDDAMQRLEETNHVPNLWNTLTSYFLSAAMGAVPALIIALILRREPKENEPPAMPQDDDAPLLDSDLEKP